MPHNFTPAHIYAEIFPLHNEGQVFFDFADDIKANGLQEPVIMFQGKVLDGRRRERGCHRAGIEPRYKEFKGTEVEALAFVVSKNLHRRHLGEGERALVAGRIITAKRGKPVNPANCGIMEKPLTTKDAADMMGVSEAAAERGKTVALNGTAKLQEAVADGTLSISDAAKVSSEPAKVQNQAVKDVKAGKATTAAKAAEEKKPKSGSEKVHFNDKPFEEIYGKLVRFIEARAQAVGKSKRHAQCENFLREFLAAYTEWKKEAA